MDLKVAWDEWTAAIEDARVAFESTEREAFAPYQRYVGVASE